MSDSFKRFDDPGLCATQKAVDSPSREWSAMTALRLHVERLAAGETIQEAPTDRHLRAATGALSFLALAFIAALVWAALVVT